LSGLVKNFKQEKRKREAEEMDQERVRMEHRNGRGKKDGEVQP
jgi:hypothetical protein